VTEPPAAPVDTTPTAPPANTDPATGTPTAPAPVTDWEAEATKWKALARKHEAQAKANVTDAQAKADRDQQLAKIAEALGLPTGTQTDATAITQQLETAKAEARQRAIELAVHRTAAKVDADGDALLDSSSFLRAVAEIDPTDLEAVADAIKTAVKTNPRLGKTAPAATTTTPTRQVSGGEFSGAPGGNGQWTAEDVARATPAALSKAMKDGKLTSYLAS
jgi:hypothetical protein